MKKRDRFSRNCIASSRGPHVSKSHYCLLQERLAERGVVADLKDIIEASINVNINVNININIEPKYYIICFGKKIPITESQAKELDSRFVIKQ